MSQFGRVAASALVAGAASVAAVLTVEGLLAARRTAVPTATAPSLDRDYIGGPIGTGNVLHLTVLGDSTAAGVGVRTAGETVGGHLAAGLARDGRTVRLGGAAVAGSRTGDLGPQVSRALLGRQPDVAVILVGSDDATHGQPLAAVRRDLHAAVARLRDAGVPVVVGTCPDLGAVPAFAQPLRAILGWRGRTVAQAQAAATSAAGGIPVDLARLTGAVFRADRGTYSEDGYHPSADGYRLLAEALLPAVHSAATTRASSL